MRFFRLLLIAIFGFIIFLPTFNLYGQAEIQINMDNLGKAWQEFVAAPSPEKAQAIYDILPNGIDGKEVRLQVDVRNLVNQSINVLESQIFSGDKISLRVAFRLFTIADDIMTQSISVILGNYLRFNCSVFLTELKSHRHLVDNLSLILCSFSVSMAGDPTGMELEKKTRLKAIDYVDLDELKDIKKECSKLLKKCKTK